MKKSKSISSVESKAVFGKKMIEKFVQQNLPPKMPKKNKISDMGQFSNCFKEVESCAVETPVRGDVEILVATKYFNLRRINVPVCSRFFVFFLRDDNNDYKVAWSCSLS